jgi:RNA polymerase sigma-70 factor, ECF subfamily
MLIGLRAHQVKQFDSTGDRSVAGMSDVELAALIRKGSDDEHVAAFDALYGRYIDTVHAYAYRRLGNREAAEDATSEIFRDVAHSLPSYRPITGKTFRSWLFTIAHHVTADHLGRQLRERAQREPLDPALQDPSPSPTDRILAAEQETWFRRQIEILPPRERQVIEFDLIGMKTAEIADVLGLADGAVHTARCRALNHLQAHLGPRDTTPEK